MGLWAPLHSLMMHFVLAVATMVTFHRGEYSFASHSNVALPPERYYNRSFATHIDVQPLHLEAFFEFNDPVYPGIDTAKAAYEENFEPLSSGARFATPQGSGTPLFTAHGYVSSAYYFDGASFLLAPIDISPSAMASATIGAWVRVASINADDRSRCILCSNVEDGAIKRHLARGLAIDSRGSAGGGTNAGWAAFRGSVGSGVLGRENVQLMTWTFVAASYSDNDGVSLHVHGKNVATGVSGMSVGASNVRIGDTFHGSIDSVFIYSVELKEAALAHIMAARPLRPSLAPSTAGYALSFSAGDQPAWLEERSIALDLGLCSSLYVHKCVCLCVRV